MSTRLHDTISTTEAPSVTGSAGGGAGVRQRRPTRPELIGAAAIDLAILLVPPAALGLLRGWTPLAVISAVELLALVIIVLACTGRTPGLAAIGARVVTAEGSTTPGLGRAAARVALTPLIPAGSGEAGFVDTLTRCRTRTGRRSSRADRPRRDPGPSDAGNTAWSAHPRTPASGRAERPTSVSPQASSAVPSSMPTGAPSSPPTPGIGGEDSPPGPAPGALASAPPASSAPEPGVRSAPIAREGILGPAAPDPRTRSETGVGDSPRHDVTGGAPAMRSETGASDSLDSGQPIPPASGRAAASPASGPIAPADPVPTGRAAPAAQEIPPPPAGPVPPVSPASPSAPSSGRRVRVGTPDETTPKAPTRRRRRATSHRAPASPAASSPSSPWNPSETPPPALAGEPAAGASAGPGSGAAEPGGPHATAPTEQAGPGAPPREDTRIARRSDRSDIVLITGSGRRVPLEGQCVIGRAPRPADPGDIQLVALDSSSSALSRSHLRIGFDDRQVWAEDLNSANGTVMVHPTGQRIRLGPQWRTAIVPGAVLLLADESITVERSA